MTDYRLRRSGGFVRHSSRAPLSVAHQPMLNALCVQASTQALHSMHSSLFTRAFSSTTLIDSLGQVDSQSLHPVQFSESTIAGIWHHRLKNVENQIDIRASITSDIIGLMS